MLPSPKMQLGAHIMQRDATAAAWSNAAQKPEKESQVMRQAEKRERERQSFMQKGEGEKSLQKASKEAEEKEREEDRPF